MRTYRSLVSNKWAWRGVIFLWISLFFLPDSAQAQANSSIPVDDNELYIGAIRMIGTIHEDALKSSSPGVTRVDAAFQRDMNINSADFAVLLGEFATETTTIWMGGGGGRALQGSARSQAMSDAKLRLEKSLSAEGWNQFRAFVNGKFRQSSFRGQIAIPAQANSERGPQ